MNGGILFSAMQNYYQILKGEGIAASEMRKNLAFYFKGKPEATNYKIQATQINTIFELKMLVNEHIAYYNSNISVAK